MIFLFIFWKRRKKQDHPGNKKTPSKDSVDNIYERINYDHVNKHVGKGVVEEKPETRLPPKVTLPYEVPAIFQGDNSPSTGEENNN